MGIRTIRLLTSSVLLVLMAESALAYNADDHEARIRRSCNSLRDSDERMGCFTGDITMIEQIRRRQRTEMRKNGSLASASTNRPSRKVPRPAPPVFEPAPETAQLPEPPQVDTSGPSEGASPRLITQTATAPSGPSAEVTTSVIPETQTQTQLPAASINSSSHAKGPQQAVTPQTPAEKPAAQATAPKTPEKADEVKDGDAKEPAALPATFAKTCATNVRELEKKPHLRAALARIMNTSEITRGSEKRFDVQGRKIKIGACFGGWGGNLSKCTGTEPATDIQVRATSSGQLQTYVQDQWVDVKTCSDGKTIESKFQVTASGYTFDLTSTFTPTKDGLKNVVRGFYVQQPEHNVILSSAIVQAPADHTRMVASQGRAPRGRN